MLAVLATALVAWALFVPARSIEAQPSDPTPGGAGIQNPKPAQKKPWTCEGTKTQVECWDCCFQVGSVIRAKCLQAGFTKGYCEGQAAISSSTCTAASCNG